MNHKEILDGNGFFTYNMDWCRFETSRKDRINDN